MIYKIQVETVTFVLIHPLDVHFYKNITCILPLRTSSDLDWLIPISLIFLCLRGPAMELWPICHALQLSDSAKVVFFFPYMVNTHLTVTYREVIENFGCVLILSVLLRLKSLTEVEITKIINVWQSEVCDLHWTVAFFSLLFLFQSLHHSPAQRTMVLKGPKRSQ